MTHPHVAKLHFGIRIDWGQGKDLWDSLFQSPVNSFKRVIDFKKKKYLKHNFLLASD